MSVDGAVRRSAIHELKGQRNVSEVDAVAGRFMPDADEKTLQLERILLRQLASKISR